MMVAKIAHACYPPPGHELPLFILEEKVAKKHKRDKKNAVSRPKSGSRRERRKQARLEAVKTLDAKRPVRQLLNHL